jgi:methionyl-tRNA synthetase
MTYYITTPLFYVNDLPHIGSAYPTIVCDFIAGHMLQRGEEVAFLTGTDEHGQKIEKAAADNHKTPKQHCDYISNEFKNLWKVLNINFDYFIRTSDQDHKNFVQDFFSKVQAKGDIYEGEYKGLYCVSCEDFWLEKDLETQSENLLHCPVHKRPVEQYAQKNYFFKLSKYQNHLEKYFQENPSFVSPDYRKNEVMGWIKEGLKDFPISRTNLTWGIPVPGDNEGQIIYVWFDALLGYLSGLKADYNKFWQSADSNNIVHIIGKDILRFHAVYWPAMLISAGLPLPKKVFGHGFLTKDGTKMGKTLGNIIDPIALAESFGAESVKYYFLREIVFGRDGDYTDESFITRLNTDLANNLGNLLSRSLKLINKYFDGVIPDIAVDPSIHELFETLLISFQKNIDEINPFVAFEELFKSLDQVNVLINQVEPWRILKASPQGSPEWNMAACSLVSSAYACYYSAFLLAPAMPNLALKIISNLGFNTQGLLESSDKKTLMQETFAFKNLNSANLKNHKIAENIDPVFSRLDLVQTV